MRALVEREEAEIRSNLPREDFAAAPLRCRPDVTDRQRNIRRLGNARCMVPANQPTAVIRPADVHDRKIQNAKDGSLPRHEQWFPLQSLPTNNNTRPWPNSREGHSKTEREPPRIVMVRETSASCCSR